MDQHRTRGALLALNCVDQIEKNLDGLRALNYMPVQDENGYSIEPERFAFLQIGLHAAAKRFAAEIRSKTFQVHADAGSHIPKVRLSAGQSGLILPEASAPV